MGARCLPNLSTDLCAGSQTTPLYSHSTGAAPMWTTSESSTCLPTGWTTLPGEGQNRLLLQLRCCLQWVSQPLPASLCCAPCPLHPPPALSACTPTPAAPLPTPALPYRSHLPCLSIVHWRSADPDLAAELGQPLEQALGFFGAAQQTYGPLLLAALSQATA